MAEDTWLCLPCNTLNYAVRGFCEACGSPRPQPMRWPRHAAEPWEDIADQPWTGDGRSSSAEPDPTRWPEEIFALPAPPEQPRLPVPYVEPEEPRRRGRVIGVLLGIVMIAAGGGAVLAVLDKSPPTEAAGPPGAVLPIPGASDGSPAPSPPVPSPSLSASASTSAKPSASASSGTPTRSVTPTTRTSAPGGSTTPPPPPPNFVGMVDVRAVNTSPQVLPVGNMFNTYFSGINARQYQPVLAVFDPSGSLNPNDPVAVAKFTSGVATTTDSQVVLWSITNDPSVAGDLDTRVTFVSHQQAGFGPPARPDETCTVWDLTYELRPFGSAVRILKPLHVGNTPC